MIWLTASIGILVGIGFWFPAVIGTTATLLVLSAFRLIESRIPSEYYAHFHVRFLRSAVMDQDSLGRLVGKHSFTIANVHSRLIDGGQLFEYRMVIKSQDRTAAQTLSKELLGLPEVAEFRISPTGD